MSLLPEIFTGVAAALVTAWFTKSSDDKKNSLKFITDERRKWREEIRLRSEKIVETVENLKKDSANSENLTELKKSRAFFEIRLNPIDKEDQAILQTLKDMVNGQYDKLEDFQGRIALLLKHDWERSKTEVGNKWKVAFIIFSLIFTAIACSLETMKPFGDTVWWEMIDVLHKKHILLLISFFLDLVSVYYSMQLILNFLTARCCDNPFATEASSKFFKLFGIHLRIIKEHDSVKTKENTCCLAKVFSFLIAFAIILAFLLYLAVLADSWNLCQTMTCCCIIKTSAIAAVAATTITACIYCKICCRKTPVKTETEPKKESNKQQNPKSKSAD